MKQLIVIAGPTAVGKTTAAIRLAQHLQTEILSCDSRQFYSELDIGVARPSPDELTAVPHHFIANRSVSNPYNIWQYEQEALATLETLFRSHEKVVMVGGSGLYIDAVRKGVSFMPDPSPQLREQIKQLIATQGLENACRLLHERDPQAYDSIDIRNPIRVQRALEVIFTSGQPYSSFLRSNQPLQRPFAITIAALQREPQALRERIFMRVTQMMEQGLLDEVRSLLQMRHLNTLNTVGYKELFAYIDGSVSLNEAVSQIQHNSWRYAKKQLTWLKRNPDVTYIDADNADQQLHRLLL